MLDSAAENYRSQQRIVARGVVAARRVRRNRRRTVEVVTAFQILAARDALNGVDTMLAEQGLDAPPLALVSPSAFAGTASDGRPLATLLDQATTDYWFSLIVATQIKDIGRMAAGASIVTRPKVGGYTRMLNPPSCSRCSVLAGKFYRWNNGFQRHPGCDCIHVPTASQAAAESEGLLLDQDAYFGSLSPTEQDRIFTKSGAQAIRDGADMGQVVNARRGMSTAGKTETTTRTIDGREYVVNVHRRSLVADEIGGRPVYLSSDGVTARGLANRARTGRNLEARLMPESIYAATSSREDALRLLRLHGYIR